MTRLRHSAPLALLFSLLLSSSSVLALEVAPGSDCAAYCLDDSDGNSNDPKDSNTNSTDIVCHDGDYSSESRGIKFKNCQECLQKSEHVNGTESDLHWFMCKCLPQPLPRFMTKSGNVKSMSEAADMIQTT